MLSRRVIASTASSESLNPSPPLMDSRRSLLHPRKSAWGGDPEVPQFTPLDCARVPPPIPRWPRRVQMTVASSPALAFTSDLQVRRSHWSFRGCRVHSELKFVLISRPASWLALLSRTFTFELSLAGSPQANVEYDYVGKQSIPTTGLSPASPTALWAAEIGLTPMPPGPRCPPMPPTPMPPVPPTPMLPKAALVGKNDLDGVAAVGRHGVRENAHRQESGPGGIAPRNLASPPVERRLRDPMELAVGPHGKPARSPACQDLPPVLLLAAVAHPFRHASPPPSAMPRS